MPYKSTEAKRAWRRRNGERINAYTRDWRERHPENVARYRERQNASSRQRTAERRASKPRKLPLSREEHNERNRAKRRKLRLAAQQRLGGMCQRCGFDDWRALEIDHIEPLLRRTRGVQQDSADSYRAVLEALDPSKKYQLLCANCHEIKTHENGERGASEEISGSQDDEQPGLW